MIPSTQVVANQALALSPEDRALVANLILQSLEAQPTTYDKEWEELSLKRSQEIKNGKVKPLSQKEFDKGIRLPNA